ncbi:Rho-GAP domain-containing protein [Heracleum sosnowskyi]|uniref:Rho-GAP domain-containing protein n=1 Tax=Heracleum sosnowskyi TaxID=360622 RepID=A0AAD8JJE8_9APIA|nr:Rho-GAP domain-containing protein [Heracleum sosnowskyi]
MRMPMSIADCIKYILRESPSYAVPTSCCTALLKAHRTDRSKRTAAMRSAIFETFPEPNCRLLQRILVVMKIVVSHEDVNRMNTSAVAACMAALLLRPLLAGDGELQNDFKMGSDSSAQLLQAAVAAANHAQAMFITLLEEYDKIFGNSFNDANRGFSQGCESCERFSCCSLHGTTGDVELQNDFKMGGDSSAQLLQAVV